MNLRLRAAGVSALALAAACLGASAVRGVTAAKTDTVPDYYITDPGEMEGAAYILRDSDGYIGVYLPGKASSPEELTAIPVSELRASDQKLLKEGIPVSSRDELLQLLEDFGS